MTRRYTLTWSARTGDLRATAQAIHEVIRAGVIAKVERGDSVPFVSGGLATPPGPTRLVLEDRRRGLPGRRFGAVLHREGAAVRLTIACSRLWPVPLTLLDPLLEAVHTVAAPERPSWTLD